MRSNQGSKGDESNAQPPRPVADRGTVERKKKGSPRWYRRDRVRDVRGEEIYVAPD